MSTMKFSFKKNNDKIEIELPNDRTQRISQLCKQIVNWGIDNDTSEILVNSEFIKLKIVSSDKHFLFNATYTFDVNNFINDDNDFYIDAEQTAYVDFLAVKNWLFNNERDILNALAEIARS